MQLAFASNKNALLKVFLGVDNVCSSNPSGPQITLLQVGLTKRIIEAVSRCSSLSMPIDTPVETSPLPKDTDGNPASGSFNYAVVVGMLLYISVATHALTLPSQFTNVIAIPSTQLVTMNWSSCTSGAI